MAWWTQDGVISFSSVAAWLDCTAVQLSRIPVVSAGIRTASLASGLSLAAGVNPGERRSRLRLRPQLELARDWGLVETDWEPLLSPVMDWLNRHAPQPCLVHGDLWAGNAAVLDDGRGLLIDPATWWADREVDLAMTQLFGGFTRRFWEGYQQEWPLDDGAEQRIEVLNLYHVLNHANLFGGGYQQQSRSTLKALRRDWL